MQNSVFDQVDFGPLNEFLNNEDITDISYSNNGQVWLKSLTQGVYKVDRPEIDNALMEKVAFQCANTMGKTFNMAHPFLDSESAELRMNFVHESIATNGIACVIRKTPAKIRLNKEKLLSEGYMTEKLHNFLEQCVLGHCNIIVSGETGSGKTELVKYLASKTKENEKIITIEDTLELHLDRIYPNRDIVAMKTNNIASYSDVLVTCMRQNPIWILLSEVRSAEAVLAVRNSISSGHHILSTIHADKASSIPMRMYSLLESSQDTEQFLASIHRYVQIGIYVKGYFSKKLNRFQREIIEVCEFYVDDDNVARSNNLYRKTMDGVVTMHNPTKHLLDYLSIGNVFLPEDTFGLNQENVEDNKNYVKTQEVNEMLNNSQVINEPEIKDDLSQQKVTQENISPNPLDNLNQAQMQNVNVAQDFPNPQATINQVQDSQVVMENSAPAIQVQPVNEQPINNVVDNIDIKPIIEDMPIDLSINTENNSSISFNTAENITSPHIVTLDDLKSNNNETTTDSISTEKVIPPLEPMSNMEVL